MKNNLAVIIFSLLCFSGPTAQSQDDFRVAELDHRFGEYLVALGYVKIAIIQSGNYQAQMKVFTDMEIKLNEYHREILGVREESGSAVQSKLYQLFMADVIPSIESTRQILSTKGPQRAHEEFVEADNKELKEILDYLQ